MLMDAVLSDTMKIAMQKYSAKLYQNARDGYGHVTTDGLFGQAAYRLVESHQKRAAFWAYSAWLERANNYPLGFMFPLVPKVERSGVSEQSSSLDFRERNEVPPKGELQ